jgi:hypothetical protein
MLPVALFSRVDHPDRVTHSSALPLLMASLLLAACSSPSSSSPQDAGHPRDAKADHTKAHDAGMHDDADKVDATIDDASLTSDARDAGNDAFFDAGPGCAVGPSGEPTDLQCTGLYSDWATKTVSSDLRSYTPGLLLWSDGAQKNRWIYLPPGTTIDTSDMDEWTFPVGTKIWKEFNLPVGDSSTPIRIETRLLWKLKSHSWYRTTYRWSADGQTSATELTQGELNVNGSSYEIPGQLLCNECHSGRLDGVLGFEAVSLASPAATGFAMPQLVEAGVLTKPPSSPLTVPGDPAESAALGWLHVNCGTSCHNDSSGTAQNTGFFTRLDVATLASVHDTDTWTTGWNVPTETYSIPDAGATYRLHACSLATSAAYYRASLRDGVNGTPSETQMPPIASHLVDEAGIALLAAWIDEACDAGHADAALDAHPSDAAHD